jgi:hypothetical protein
MLRHLLRHAMSSPVARATRCHLLRHAPRDVISCGTRHAMSSPGVTVRSVRTTSVPPDTTCRLARDSRQSATLHWCTVFIGFDTKWQNCILKTKITVKYTPTLSPWKCLSLRSEYFRMRSQKTTSEVFKNYVMYRTTVCRHQEMNFIAINRIVCRDVRFADQHFSPGPCDQTPGINCGWRNASSRTIDEVTCSHSLATRYCLLQLRNRMNWLLYVIMSYGHCNVTCNSITVPVNWNLETKGLMSAVMSSSRTTHSPVPVRRAGGRSDTLGRRFGTRWHGPRHVRWRRTGVRHTLAWTETQTHNQHTARSMTCKVTFPDPGKLLSSADELLG